MAALGKMKLVPAGTMTPPPLGLDLPRRPPYATPGYGDSVQPGYEEDNRRRAAEFFTRGGMGGPPSGILAQALANPPTAPEGVLAGALAAAPGRAPVDLNVTLPAPPPASLPTIDMGTRDAKLEAKRPGFLAKGGVGWDILGTVLDAASAGTGGQPTYWATKLARQQQREQRERELLDRAMLYQREDKKRAEDRDWEANKPDTFSAGRDRVRYDPRTGATSVIYNAPEQFEDYAAGFGTPGTPEYRAAAQDYVLRGNGPTAYGYDVGLEEAEQDNRVEVEGVRQSNRVGLEGVRQRNRSVIRAAPTYRDLNPRAPAPRQPREPTPASVLGGIYGKFARGEQLSPQEAVLLNSATARGKGRPGIGAAPAGGGGPKVGTVKDGFRFNGGNPADRANWKPVGGAASQGAGRFR